VRVRVLLDVSAVPARPAGAGVYTCALAGGLARHEAVELHLASRRDDASRWREIAPGAEVHAEAPMTRPLRIAWEQASAGTLAERVGAHLWHGPHYTMPLRSAIPAIVTMHDLTFFDHPEWHERTKVPYFRRMIRASARRAAGIVCVSQYTADRLAAVAPPCGPVVVARHGVDHERFRPDGDAADDRARLARHGVTAPYVAFVGTIEPRKNIPALVTAFGRVVRDHPDLRLALVGGDGWGSVSVRDAIAASGVATRIVRTGYVDDAVVPALLRRAECAVYPSLEEGFGVPALEALACGAPLVTSAGSALAEVVGDAAVTVDATDVDALSSALRALVEDRERAAALRARGPAHARTFTWEHSIETHVDLYRTIAATRAAV
jgi:glycosyltransferase involved in cell wall biosynthesis